MSATTPEACDELFGQYINAGNLDALVALYEPTAVLRPQPGVSVSGHAGLREALGNFVAAKAQIRMHVVDVLRAGTDLAVLYNDWRGTVTGPDGKPTEIAGRAIEIVRRQVDGTWRFVIDDPYARG